MDTLVGYDCNRALMTIPSNAVYTVTVYRQSPQNGRVNNFTR